MRRCLAALQCALVLSLAAGLVPLHAAGPDGDVRTEQVTRADATTGHDHRLCLLYWSSLHEASVPSPASSLVARFVVDRLPLLSVAPPRVASPSLVLPRAPPRSPSIQA